MRWDYAILPYTERFGVGRLQMGLSRRDPQRLRAGGYAFDAITLRCRKCNMTRRGWDKTNGKALCDEAVKRELRRQEEKASA
jgi:hypothetical protein